MQPMGRWGVALVVLAGLGISPPTRADEPVIRAGAATSNITPDLGEPIIGNFATPKAQHIHDDLHARCLVLDDGNAPVAIVVCDNLGIGRPVFDAARKRIHDDLKIDPGRILLASTHTHSGTAARWENLPVPGPERAGYHEFVVRRIADGVRCAWNNREPAEVGWGAVDLPGPLHNRRWLFEPGHKPPLNPFGMQDQAMMNPGANRPGLREPAGPTDPQVSFLSVRSREGRPIALLANYSLHYVGGVPEGHISADYFGAFARAIALRLDATRLDPPFVGILSNGTSGDVNNIDVRHPSPPLPPYRKIEQVAGEVADAVHRGLGSITYHRQVPLAAATRELTLTNRIPTATEVERAQAVLAKPENAPKVNALERIYASRVLELREVPATETILLQAVRIGEVGIAAIPFEVFTETGLAIKAASPLPRTFTIELANGSYGYLPTPRQHALGGYETWMGTNRVEVSASDKIEATILDLLRQIGPADPR